MRRLVAMLVIVMVVGSLPASVPVRADAHQPLGHRGRWLTDEHGRVAVLRGVNMVRKLPPYLPSAIGFDEDDAAFLASEGFNTVRLGIIYKALEPVRGHYNDEYLDAVLATARTLGAHGIHVLLDFHQDLFNERFNGEGFPDWAVIDDGLPAQPDIGFPGNYFVMPALQRAFDHFWANDPAPDGVGLQDAYAAAWRHVARRARAESSIFGYDIFNETWPGSVWPSCLNPNGCPLFDAQLTEFYKRVFGQIRLEDPDRLVFYETHPIFGGGADVHIGDTGDAHAGFSFHVYCLGAAAPPEVVGDFACPLGVERPFERADAQSQRTGDALLLTEFGATDHLPSLRRDVETADRYTMSWQYWTYSGGDPSGERPHEGIIIDPSQPPTPDNVKQEKLDILARPYPRATAGTPVFWRFIPEGSSFVYSFEADPAIDAPTEIVVPLRHYPDGASVTVGGPAEMVSFENGIVSLKSTDSGRVLVTVERPSDG